MKEVILYTCNDFERFVYAVDKLQHENIGRFIALKRNKNKPYMQDVLFNRCCRYDQRIYGSYYRMRNHNIDELDADTVYFCKINGVSATDNFIILLDVEIIDKIDASDGRLFALLSILMMIGDYCKVKYGPNHSMTYDACLDHEIGSSIFMSKYLDCLYEFHVSSVTDRTHSFSKYPNVIAAAASAFNQCINLCKDNGNSPYQKFITVATNYTKTHTIHKHSKVEYEPYKFSERSRKHSPHNYGQAYDYNILKMNAYKPSKRLKYPATEYDKQFDLVFDDPLIIRDYYLLDEAYQAYFDKHPGYDLDRNNSLNYFRMLLDHYNKLSQYKYYQEYFRDNMPLKADNVFEMLENLLLIQRNHKINGTSVIAMSRSEK